MTKGNNSSMLYRFPGTMLDAPKEGGIFDYIIVEKTKISEVTGFYPSTSEAVAAYERVNSDIDDVVAEPVLETIEQPVEHVSAAFLDVDSMDYAQLGAYIEQNREAMELKLGDFRTRSEADRKASINAFLATGE